MRRIGIYAGSFDPPTNGHLWVINSAAMMFDELIVAIGNNPDKDYMFSAEERAQMLRECCPNVRVVDIGTAFVIHAAQQLRAHVIVRGIRSAADFPFEQVMRNVNSDIDNDILSIFLMPPPQLTAVSSSMVKGLIGPAGWPEIVARYVPDSVLRRLEERFNAK